MEDQAMLVNTIEEQRSSINHISRLMEIFTRKPANQRTRGFTDGLLRELEAVHRQVSERHNEITEIARESSLLENEIPYFQEGVYYDVLDRFLTAQGTLLDALETASGHPLNSTHFESVPQSTRSEIIHSNVRLPQIDVPTFSGDYLSWITFRDLFISLVDKNISLTKTQKFYFLRSACKDTPLEIISEYPVAETSYDLAWNALNARYSNKRKIVELILNKLLSIPASDGSVASIKKILDSTKNILALLTTMQINNWEALLVHLTVTKLDKQTHKEWEQSLQVATEVPTKQQLFSFLETTFRTLESVEDHAKLLSMTSSNTSNKLNSSKRNGRSVNVTTTESDGNCPCCEKRHFLYKCFKFSSLPDAAKRELLKARSLCHNCLKPGHFSQDCNIKGKCQECQQSHHSSIHRLFSAKPATKPSAADTTAKANGQEIAVLTTSAIPQVLLGTLHVTVKSKGVAYSLRALMDQGSQASLITEEAAQLLDLAKFTTNVPISGIGKSAVFAATKGVKFTLSSSYEPDFELHWSALILPKLTSNQPPSLSRNELPSLAGFTLADPQFDKPEKIHLLLGADICGEILKPQIKQFTESIFLQQTHFGWIISGPTSKQQVPTVSVNMCSLESQLRAFWEQEELTETRKRSNEETACEQHFEKTHDRDKTGRYSVHLSFKATLSGKPLPSFSYTDYSALRRLKQLEHRLAAKPQFDVEYRKFMNEYESLGHMYRLGTYPKDIEASSYFLPHHGVFRESSTTTKLRVVFDGSSKSHHGLSLNEELSPGPALQNDLPNIITKWRRFKFGFRADLEKMFRQIKVTPEHHKYQQILWRHNVNEPIGIYRLSTVTYGTTCAPYLSIRALHQLTMDETKKFPDACKVLFADTYVDDVISGADTHAEAIQLQQQLCQLLKAGCFNLRKWISNSDELMSTIPEHARDSAAKLVFDENDTIKALGLEWQVNNDTFSFSVKPFKDRPITKRNLLSDASRLYDPLGWLAPTTITAKLRFQQLWLLNLQRNDELPDNMQEDWKEYQRGLQLIETIKIPRWLGGNATSSIEIVGFCDASSVAFAAVAYARIHIKDSEILVRLLQSKTKVAPLKTISIPRLELCGALLLNKLFDLIRLHFPTNFASVRCFTDSTTVLAWIHTPASKLTVFVANRVAEIQRRSNPSQWQYISSKENPADCASRGISAAELSKHPLWWTGPSWISKDEQHWPPQPQLNLKTDLEIRPTTRTVLTITKTETVYPDILFQFSSLQKLKQVTAYLLRLSFNTKNKSRSVGQLPLRTGVLTTAELTYSLTRLLRAAQHAESADEIQCLSNNQPGLVDCSV